MKRSTLLATLLFSAISLNAQSTTTTSTAMSEQGPPSNAITHHPTNPAADKTTTTSTTSTTHKTMKHHRIKALSSTAHKEDLGRLQAILVDLGTSHTLPAAVLQREGEQAWKFASRIGPSSNDDVKNLRLHVKELRDAARNGDQAGAASHAAMALPYAGKIEG